MIYDDDDNDDDDDDSHYDDNDDDDVDDDNYNDDSHDNDDDDNDEDNINSSPLFHPSNHILFFIYLPIYSFLGQFKNSLNMESSRISKIIQCYIS